MSIPEMLKIKEYRAGLLVSGLSVPVLSVFFDFPVNNAVWLSVGLGLISIGIAKFFVSTKSKQ